MRKRTEFRYSAGVHFSAFEGKEFKIVTETVRAAIKNKHGYGANANIKDKRLSGPVVLYVRFATKTSRKRFIEMLQSIFHPEVFAKLNVTKVKPRKHCNAVVSIRRCKGDLAQGGVRFFEPATPWSRLQASQIH